MFTQISYQLIFGKPLIMYMGIATIISLLVTASIGYMNYKGHTFIPLKWHFFMAKITLVLALIHGFFGIAAYF